MYSARAAIYVSRTDRETERIEDRILHVKARGSINRGEQEEGKLDRKINVYKNSARANCGREWECGAGKIIGASTSRNSAALAAREFFGPRIRGVQFVFSIPARKLIFFSVDLA